MSKVESTSTNIQTDIQVESSLIVLTHPIVLKFINYTLKPARLESIKDISGTSVWANGGTHMIGDISNKIKYYILHFTSNVSIAVFADAVKNETVKIWVSIIDIRPYYTLSNSIINIQKPWSETRRVITTTAPLSKKGMVPPPEVFGDKPKITYKIVRQPNGSYAATYAGEVFTGPNEEAVMKKIENRRLRR